MSWIKGLNINTIIQRLGNVWSRFSLSLICFYIATFILLYVVDSDDSIESLFSTMAALALAGLTTLVATIYVESRGLSGNKKWIAYAMSLLVPLIYWCVMPSNVHDSSACYGWFSLGLLTLSILGILLAPYLFSDKGHDAYITYCYKVLLRLAETVFFGFVLAASLSLALAAIDQLFGVSVKGHTFSRLFISIAGIFCTTYYLSIFPKSYTDIQQARSKALSIFGQYVLVPIIFIYALILYAYLAKVLGQSEWPQAWVKYLITWFLILGTCTYIFNQYTTKESITKIAKWYNRIFYWACIPVSILLLISVYREYSKDGITEEIYLLGVTAVWSLLLSLYMIIARRDDTRWIPISLGIAAIIAFFSPFNICKSIVHSQLGVVESKLTDAGLLSDGQLVAGSETQEIDNIAQNLYKLDDYKALNRLRSWDDKQLIKQEDMSVAGILNALNIQSNFNHRSEQIETLFIDNGVNNSYTVIGYEEMLALRNYIPEDSQRFAYLNANVLMIYKNGSVQHEFDMTQLLEGLHKETKEITLSDEQADIKIMINQMNVTKSGRKRNIQYLEGWVLYRSKLK